MSGRGAWSVESACSELSAETKIRLKINLVYFDQSWAFFECNQRSDHRSLLLHIKWLKLNSSVFLCTQSCLVVY